MRQTCPESNRRIYLDHNATTPTHPEVVKAMGVEPAIAQG